MDGKFYKRKLPESCVPYGSVEGIRRFSRALEKGTALIHFNLMSHFRTQDEPSFCGLGTLVMCLNAMNVDPGRAWKGVWRWYAEDMLDCCVSIDDIKKRGIDLEEFACVRFIVLFSNM